MTSLRDVLCTARDEVFTMDEALVGIATDRIMRALTTYLPFKVGGREHMLIRGWLSTLEEPTHLTLSDWFWYEFQPNSIMTQYRVRFWDGQVLDLTPPPEMW
jgi:hypothetical protein